MPAAKLPSHPPIASALVTYVPSSQTPNNYTSTPLLTLIGLPTSLAPSFPSSLTERTPSVGHAASVREIGGRSATSLLSVQQHWEGPGFPGGGFDWRMGAEPHGGELALEWVFGAISYSSCCVDWWGGCFSRTTVVERWMRPPDAPILNVR